MGRRRDQEDVFKPLNDSPATEPDQPTRSGRGWEVKIGLLALTLVLGATGYFAYAQLKPDDVADETAAGSSRLQLEGDAAKPAANQVVTAYAPVVVESEPDAHPLVAAQFNDVSASAMPPQADAWTSSESAADQVPQSLEATPNQSYAANFGSDSPSQTPLPDEKTYAPTPDPNKFSASTTTPLPSDLTSPTRENPYRDRFSTMAPESTLPGYPPTQAEAASPTANQWSTPVATNSQPLPAADDLSDAPRSEYAPSASVPPAMTSTAPVYTPPSETYAPAYTARNQGADAGPATTAPSYSTPPATTPLTPDSYKSHQPYASPTTTTKTQAGYAGLSGTTVAEEKAGAEVWQQPSVVPVDGKYTAQPNDNFYTISRKVYGSGAYFEALSRYNKDKYPKANQIRIGDTVQAPPVEALESRYPELCPKPEHRDAAKRRSAASRRSLAGRRVYVVQEGDNLFDIARFELGARAKVADLI